jgi:hypothetical protein
MPSIGSRLFRLFKPSTAERKPPVEGGQNVTTGEPTRTEPSDAKRVAEGELEVAGKEAAQQLGDHRGALGGTAGFEGARSPMAMMMAQKTGAPVRPQRADFDSDEAFDKAYLSYQSAQMAKLAAQYLDAAVHGEVFHGTTLPPEVVFKEWLPMKGDGDCFDLKKHQAEFTTVDMPDSDKSALRGSCLDARMPGKFADEGGWVYILKPLGGAISLESALGDDQARGAQGETEFSFGARQPGRQILAALPVGAWSDNHDAYRLGKRIDNPDADPQ